MPQQTQLINTGKIQGTLRRLEQLMPGQPEEFYSLAELIADKLAQHALKCRSDELLPLGFYSMGLRALYQLQYGVDFRDLPGPLVIEFQEDHPAQIGMIPVIAGAALPYTIAQEVRGIYAKMEKRESLEI